MAGKLSHPKNMPPVPVRYLGPLSRFAEFRPSDAALEAPVQDIEFCAYLSGPEPHRSILENLAKKRMERVQGKTVLVRGLPPYLPAKELAGVLLRSKHILCRPGYSSLMDFAALGILGNPRYKLEFVPTPGQTEQEYLRKISLPPLPKPINFSIL
jgi:hypothetical protein